MLAVNLPVLKKHHHQRKQANLKKRLNYIAKLYGIEKQAKGLSASERQALRKQQAQTVLCEFKEWLDAQNVLPKGLLGKAITYTQNQWPKLLTYLEDGNISIDNNVTDRDIRPFTKGRKIGCSRHP